MSLNNTSFGAKNIEDMLKNAKSIFFDGIGGISMCSLAKITHMRGYKVAGYDRTPSDATENLIKAGIDVFYDSDASHVNNFDALVYTVSIPSDNAEYTAAGELGIPRISRADYLGYIMMNYNKRIGVSGTHGKSTTTSMLECIFTKAGTDPTVSCGAVMKSVGEAYKIGKKDFFIFEACEYMDAFLDFYPTTAIILNMELDHIDYFSSIDQMKESYQGFTDKCPDDGFAVINMDDENIMSAAGNFKTKAVTFAVKNQSADFTADKIDTTDKGVSFDILKSGKFFCHVSLPIPGSHYIYDALAAAAAAFVNGISADSISQGLSSFKGSARRMDYQGKIKSGASVFTDYAHHPTELAATLECASNMCSGKVIAVFQPHTYSRTQAFFDDFASVLSNCDEVILTHIYSARETNIYGVSPDTLSDKINELGGNCRFMPDFLDIAAYINGRAKSDDMVLIIGAGDVVSLVKLMF